MRPEADDSEATDLTDDSSCGAPAEEAKLCLRKRNREKKLVKKVPAIKVSTFTTIIELKLQYVFYIYFSYLPLLVGLALFIGWRTPTI